MIHRSLRSHAPQCIVRIAYWVLGYTQYPIRNPYYASSRLLALVLLSALLAVPGTALGSPEPGDSIPGVAEGIASRATKARVTRRRAAGLASPKEVKALWVPRHSLCSPAAIRTMVTQAQENGFNTLIVQVRGRGELYCAGPEPRAEELAGQPQEWDPLEEVIREARAAGLSVHAWINAMYVWSRPTPPAAREHIVHAHPDWLMVNRAGRKVAVGDEGVFTCPSHPEVRRHLHNLFLSIARRYDVDGVQFDYIRYPGADYCYCAGCLTRFKRKVRPLLPPDLRASLDRRPGRLVYPQVLAHRWSDWRREQITSLVRWIYRDLKALRPELMVSADVIAWGEYPGDFEKSEAYRLLGQDWYGWLREGIVDVVVPMTYQTSTPAFGRWVSAVRRAHPERPVWFGIGAYLFAPESAAAKIGVARAAGAAGWSLFSWSAITKEGRDDSYLRALRPTVGQSVATAE
jgi:uncharacterized lipoprotein YddW (UPF0748 family)